MKYQIRKCEAYTVCQSTEVVELDPKKFKKLENNPYTGETEEDFLNYIAEFANTCRYEGVPDDLDDNTKQEILKLTDDANWTEYHNSAWDGEQSWYQLGEADEKYRKTGGFNAKFSTND